MSLANEYIIDFFQSNLNYLIKENGTNFYDVTLTDGEVIAVHISDLSITGTERAKPQIRLNSNSAKKYFEQAKSEGKRFFWLTYFSDQNYQNLGQNNTNSDENNKYILSLETNPVNIRPKREDIRSLYDWLNQQDVISDTANLKKCNSVSHNNNNIYQGTFIRVRNQQSLLTTPLDDYLKIFDSRHFYMNRKKKEMAYKPIIGDNSKRNRISFGAPGTGKSYFFKKLLKDVDKSQYERVTFYSDYTYSQFIGTYKPYDLGGEITYKFVPGPFTRLLIKALKSGLNGEEKKYYLVIEEINRAKAASVFGDMFQLLDRDDSGASEYSINVSEDMANFFNDEFSEIEGTIDRIKIPNNLYIYATMNSADQGVFPMDTAFKRRWDFKYIGVDEEEFQRDSSGQVVECQGETFNISGKEIEWNVLRRAINARLSSQEIKVHEDKLMGPFFMKIKDKDGELLFDPVKKDEEFINLFCDKVLMYLFEDAVKTKREKMFQGIVGETLKLSRYSEVCKVFKQNGVSGLFGDDFIQNEYTNQKQERDTAKSNFRG